MSSHQVLHWVVLEFEQALLVLESVSNYKFMKSNVPTLHMDEQFSL